LLALSAGMKHPRELYLHGLLFGKRAAVGMAIKRLERRGLIERKARITDKGRAELQRVSRADQPRRGPHTTRSTP